MIFQFIKRIGTLLINTWQRTKHTKRSRGFNKALDGQVDLASKLIAHKLPRKSINEEERISEQSVSILKKEGATEAVRISDSEGQAIAADAREDGSVDYSASGKSRQGETGNTEICQILVNRLNRDGANWGTPIDVTKILGRREEGIDCEAKDGEKVLKIQVTRAERDPKFWKELNTSNGASRIKIFEELADDLRYRIQAKVGRIPPKQRKELILALDATDTPGYAFQQVIDSFHNRYGDWAVEQGFLGIWVVGPNVTLTSRLDEQVHS